MFSFNNKQTIKYEHNYIINFKAWFFFLAKLRSWKYINVHIIVLNYYNSNIILVFNNNNNLRQLHLKIFSFVNGISNLRKSKIDCSCKKKKLIDKYNIMNMLFFVDFLMLKYHLVFYQKENIYIYIYI